MSTTANQSGGSRSESLPFMEWSEYDENRWRYEDDLKEIPEPDIWNPDAQNGTTIRYVIDCRYDPEKQRKYKRLSEYNSGLRNGQKWTNDKYNKYLVNRHLIQALASQVGLNPRYKREAERLFLGLNLQRFGADAGTVAFCTCIAVVKESGENDRKCHPCVPDEKMDPEFKEVTIDEGYQKEELISLYNKVTQAKDKYWGRPPYINPLPFYSNGGAAEEDNIHFSTGGIQRGYQRERRPPAEPQARGGRIRVW